MSRTFADFNRGYKAEHERAEHTGLSADQIAKVVRLFSSPSAGEAGAAAMALLRMAVDAGHDVHWLAETIAAAMVLKDEPSLEELPSDDEGWLPVRSVTLYVHRKACGSWPTVRVEYLTPIGKFADWWPIEHGGHASDFGHQKWRALGGGLPLPETADEAVQRQDELYQDIEIMVDTGGRYPQVIGQRRIGAAS
jgi:hypothetical protein